jgi:septal ring-binding cell division protein DamX
MNNRDQNFPPQDHSQDSYSQDSLSQGKFDEMDELALSLQRQIKDLDNIPELDGQLEDSLAEDSYESLFNQQARIDDDSLQSRSKNESLGQQLKKRLLKQTFDKDSQLPIFLKLHVLIPFLIALFFIISSASYWLFRDSAVEEFNQTQDMTLSLPEKPTSLLAEKSAMSERMFDNRVDRNVENSVDSNEAITKIPLIYLDVKENKQQPIIAEITPVNDTTSLLQPLKSNNTLSGNEKNSTQSSINTTINTDSKIKNNYSLKKKASVIQVSPVVDNIMPSPVIGNTKRQWIDIKGKNFNDKTSLVLQWTEKAKSSIKLRSKLFSMDKKNSQLQLVNHRHLKLHINVGLTERHWQLKLKNQNLISDEYQFKVVKPFTLAVKKSPNQYKKKEDVTKHSRDRKSGKNQNYLQNQPDQYFTLQLLGSSNYNAIQKVVQKHTNYKKLFWYKNKRDGKDWYTLFYGSYATKEKALYSYNQLPKPLKSVKPWVRSIKDLKKQLINNYDRQDVYDVNQMFAESKIQKTQLIKNIKSQQQPNKMRSIILSEAAAQWTLQLISLSSEKAIQDYIKKNKLSEKGRYFKRYVNGDTIYTLLYSSYDSKELAALAQKKLPATIRKTKPWIRKYGDIQKQMK